MNYDILVSGDYKLLIEPIAYFSFQGAQFAMTAHEAALYDLQVSGQLRATMGNLSHKNLPLSLFLEFDDMGFPAWGGSSSEMVNTNQIISALGLGIVRFEDIIPDEEIEEEKGDKYYEYRTDTDVITSVVISAGSEINPDNGPAKVTFNIQGKKYVHDEIVVPSGGSQYAFVKWHTPKEPATITVSVSTTMGSIDANTVVCKIVDMDENQPPDPKATDRNDSFTIPPVPNNAAVTTRSWGKWTAKWHEKWVWVSKMVKKKGSHNSDCQPGCAKNHYKWEDQGKYEDQGWWDYTWHPYFASISATMQASPDEKAPTASGKTMPSGYGMNLEVQAYTNSTAPSGHYTALQNVVSYYPEFDYQSFWRLSDRMVGGSSAFFELKENRYSTYGQRVHFSPVWYPDGAYRPYAYVLDAWTPDGMLYVYLDDTITIKDSVYDDWFIGKKK